MTQFMDEPLFFSSRVSQTQISFQKQKETNSKNLKTLSAFVFNGNIMRAI